MNEPGTWLAGAFGIFVMLAWLSSIVLVLGLVAFALRRRDGSRRQRDQG